MVALNDVQASIKTTAQKTKVMESLIAGTDLGLVELSNRVGKGSPDEVKAPIQKQLTSLEARLMGVENSTVDPDLVDFVNRNRAKYGENLKFLIQKICVDLTTKFNKCLKTINERIEEGNDSSSTVNSGSRLGLKIAHFDKVLSSLESSVKILLAQADLTSQGSGGQSGSISTSGFLYATPFATPNRGNRFGASNAFDDVGFNPTKARDNAGGLLLQAKIEQMTSEISHFRTQLDDVSAKIDRVQDEKGDQVISIGGKVFSGFSIFEVWFKKAISEISDAQQMFTLT